MRSQGIQSPSKQKRQVQIAKNILNLCINGASWSSISAMREGGPVFARFGESQPPRCSWRFCENPFIYACCKHKWTDIPCGSQTWLAGKSLIKMRFMQPRLITGGLMGEVSMSMTASRVKRLHMHLLHGWIQNKNNMFFCIPKIYRGTPQWSFREGVLPKLPMTGHFFVSSISISRTLLGRVVRSWKEWWIAKSWVHVQLKLKY